MCGLSLLEVSRGCSLLRCTGLSLRWLLLLRSTGSRRSGSIVVAHKLSCPTAHGIFPNHGLNLHLLHCRRILYSCTAGDALLVFLRSVKPSFSFKTHLTGGISGLPPSPRSAVYMCIRASFDCTQCLGSIHCPWNTVAIHIPPVGRWLVPDSARTKGCLHTYLSFLQLIHQLVFLKHLLIMCKALGLDKRFFKSFCLIQQSFFVFVLSVVIYYENTKDVRDMASNLKRHSARFPWCFRCWEHRFNPWSGN